ncbi:MAG: rRNA maturation RNase YbeY [Patescibacteria group bacterium]
MEILFVDRARRKIPTALLRRDIRQVLRAKANRRARLETISIISVTAEESRRLNRQFLNKLRPANVLSFRYDGQSEIVITPTVIFRQARAGGRPYRGEIRRMVLHGLLHLAGHHHEASGRQAIIFGKLEQRLLKHLKITSHGK